MISSGEFTETFVTSARVGGRSTYELGVLNPQNHLLPDRQAQFAWVSGQVVNFSLEYDGSVVKYSVGNQLLSTTTFSGRATDLFIRTRAANQSSIRLGNLMLTDATGALSIANTGSAGSDDSDIDYVRLQGLTGPFTITGSSVMSWTGTAPTQSALIYQFKVGTSTAVPEPASLAAIALIGAAGLNLRRRSL
ncbi:MAG: PEP-CTERM sorting domain-containing protein [Synechococcales cyanobacterium CRU_2_2]|nr:PEP-CTERM sorting domain-containing protein [Synechococcales cyanobacterium CRU_2_2]